MAEWLRTGLQIRLRRFDSGSGLHFLPFQFNRGTRKIVPQLGGNPAFVGWATEVFAIGAIFR